MESKSASPGKRSGSASGSLPVNKAGVSLLLKLKEDYTSCMVAVDVRKVKKTRHIVRQTNEEHPSVNTFKSIFSSGGYGALNKYISVCIVGMPTVMQNELRAYLEKNANANIHTLGDDAPFGVRKFIANKGVYYIDGMHRGAALSDASVKKEMDSRKERVNCFLYFRNDGKPMQETDVIIVGASLNAQDGLSITMSLGDRCHAATSSLLSLMDLQEKCLNENSTRQFRSAYVELQAKRHAIGIDSFRVLMEEMRVNSDVINFKQRGRYNRIHRGVFRFSTDDEKASLLQEATNRGSLTLFSFSCIWEQKTFEEQLFVLHAVVELFKSTHGTHHRRKNSLVRNMPNTAFAKLSNKNLVIIVNFLIRLWERMNKSILHGLSINPSEFFTYKVLLTPKQPHHTCTVEDKVLDLLAEVTSSEIVSASSEKASSHMRYIQKNLLLHFKTDEERKKCRVLDKEGTEDGTPVKEGNEPTNEDEMQESQKMRNAIQPWKEDKTTNREQSASAEGSLDGYGKKGTNTCKELTVKGSEASVSKVHGLSEKSTDSIGKELITNREQTIGTFTESPINEQLPIKVVDDRGIDVETETNISLSKRQAGDDLAIKSKKREIQSNDLDCPSRRSKRFQGSGRVVYPIEPTSAKRKLSASKKVISMSARHRSLLSEAAKKIRCSIREWDFDSNGNPGDSLINTPFEITKKQGGYIGWKCAPSTLTGFTSITEEQEDHAFECAFPGNWLYGNVDVLGHRVEKIRVFEDRERPYTKLNPEFKVQEPLGPRTQEFLIPELPLSPSNEVYNRIVPKNAREVQKILRVLGLRLPHRSHFMKTSFCDYVLLLRNLFHSIVSSNPEEFCAAKLVSESDCHPDTVHEVVSTTMNTYFKSCRRQLDTAGFVVFDGIFKEKGLIKENEWKSGEDLRGEADFGKLLQRFFKFWEKKTPSPRDIEQDLLTEEHFELWSSIKNKESHDALPISDVSRFMSTTHATTSFLESDPQNKERMDMLKIRCSLDVILMQMCASLQLSNAAWSSSPKTIEERYNFSLSHQLRAPDTGGRIIATSTRKTPKMIGHLDFVFDKSVELAENGSIKYPPYFLIVTANEGAPIWIAEGSQKFINTSVEEMKSFGKKYTMRLVRIPPWSLIIVRGDVYHGGAGGRETEGKRCFRYHMYAMREGVATGDVINDFVGKFMDYNKKDLFSNIGEIRKF